ncbi:alpha/beta fold hydrolase [Nocardia sp. NPDC051030]|uniref:alpha/beta hydrolase n=1 Tax=Nocardia sp. NPDC051030 TaxID=3155162 RepID=UPI0034242560
MPYLDGARGRLHYRRWPIENPVALIALLPGIGQHSGHYHRFARALEPAGIELCALDTSGHGLSEGDAARPGTLPELSADATTFLNAIRPHPNPPLILMGHSLGAATAFAVLADDPAPPCAGLILCGTPKAVFEGLPPKSARGSDASDPGGSSAVSRARTEGAVRRTAAPRTAAPGDDAVVAQQTGGRGGLGCGRRTSAAAGPVLPEGLPVLVVHGVDDRRAPIDPVRAWAGKVAVTFREYSDAGHDLLHEPVAAQVSADIAEWVRAFAGVR